MHTSKRAKRLTSPLITSPQRAAACWDLFMEGKYGSENLHGPMEGQFQDILDRMWGETDNQSLTDGFTTMFATILVLLGGAYTGTPFHWDWCNAKNWALKVMGQHQVVHEDAKHFDEEALAWWVFLHPSLFEDPEFQLHMYKIGLGGMAFFAKPGVGENKKAYFTHAQVRRVWMHSPSTSHVIFQ